MEPDFVRNVAQKIGYRNFVDLRSGASLTEVFKKSDVKNGPGVYLLALSTDTFYIGQTKNILLRYQEHVYAGRNVDYFAWIACSKKQLDSTETDFISRALRMNLPLVNRAKIPALSLRAEDYFDDLIPAQEQDAHLAHVSLGAYSVRSRIEHAFPQTEPAQQELWTKFMQHPRKNEILEALRAYVPVAIPNPHACLFNYWYLSVSSASEKMALRPAASVMTGPFKALEIFHFSQSPEVVFVRLRMAANILFTERKALRRVLMAYPWANFVWGERPLHYDNIPDFPKPNEEELMSHCPMKHAYPNTEARAKDIVRPISLTRLYEPVTLTCTLEQFRLIFEDVLIQTAACAFAVASMRYMRVPKPELHNPTALAAVLPEAY